MRAIRSRWFFAPSILALCAVPATLYSAGRGPLVNPAEIHDELKLAPGSEAAVAAFFPSFLDYQDLIMFHPKFGYYASGRVSFSDDYQTFPIVLAPYFGQMVAEQIFHMWDGMRQAGTLAPDEPFTIAEFGAGNGSLAESILNYIHQQAMDSSDRRWREFSAQLAYTCYDRSPALSAEQRKRNAPFGKQFQASEGDATNPTATIPAGSLKGVVLSNELPDAFSVHKVILSTTGLAEAAFVVPSLSGSAWEKLKGSVPASVAELIAQGDRAVKEKLFTGKPPAATYLTRDSFVALLESLISSKEYEAAVQSVDFHEIYVPAGSVPELAGHLRRYARLYGEELAKTGRGVVTYINLGEEKFIQGAGRILAAGYVLTIDYGSSWDGIMAEDSHPHLRTYGPEHREQNPDPDPAAERDTSDPYRGPTLNDITTDVNFSLMDAEGQLAGLRTIYFGQQSALQKGTPISVEAPPADRIGDEERLKQYKDWAKSFHTDEVFKLLVQQKQNTDSSFKYPDDHPEPLAVAEDALSGAQRQKAADIERRLSGAADTAN